jgi:hypothetical protein
MKLAEKILILIAIIGLIFKLMNWPFAGLILTISLTSLSILYIGFSYFLYKKTEKNNIALSIISGVFLSILLNGILFKLMHWPLAGIQLLLGIMHTAIIFVIAFILFFTSDNLKQYCKKISIRTGIWLVIGILLYSTTTTTTLIKIQHRDDPELIRLMINAYTKPYNERDYIELLEYETKQDSLLIKFDELNIEKK